MNKQQGRTAPRALALAISGIAWGAAHAQAMPPAAGNDQAAIQEVIVTAQRTATPASKTPVAMSVLDGAQLEKAGLDTPGDIADRLPNTYLQNSYDGLRITIRGISSSDNTEKGDPSAAFMVDGIYIARPQSQNVSFHDIDRVEVLRGPQGTLYGRNTTAGVVNVISKAPVWQREGSIGITVGNYATHKVDAMLNLPVNDVLALRAALTWNEHDSYLRNGTGTSRKLGLDRDDRAARLSAKFKLGQDADLLVRYETSRDDTNNDAAVPDTNFYSGIPKGQPVWNGDSTDRVLTNRFVPFNAPTEQGYSHKKTSSISTELNWNLGPVTLSWLGSHRDYEHQYLYNFYYRVAPTVALGVRQHFDGDYKQDSHELRVATRGDGPLQAQAGVYWFREESSDLYNFRDLERAGLPPYYVFQNDPVASRSKALFGQASYRIADGLRATAGVRFTDDDKSRTGTIGYQRTATYNAATDLRELNVGSISSNKTTWRLGLDYDLAPATMVYGSVATGYKSGGFNDGCVAGSAANGIGCPAGSAVPAESLVYQPETVRAFEAGLKTRFWNNRASLNLAAFHYDYKNLQLSAEAVVNGKPRYETVNAGEASVRGLEADGQVLATAADRFTYALTLLDAHYTRYAPDGVHSWAGTKLDRTPTRTASLGYEHRLRLAGGSLVGAVGTRASSGYLISVPSQQLKFRVPGHAESDLRLGWEPDGARWSLQARVRNLEDKVRPLTISGAGLTVPSNPRTADLRFDYRFF
ncbi:TonB-dependent receptor [Massilia sp. YIM B02763]|uniref:TonB-dependent receptor n=1 Tax=Massilia sp. YIM B02763 TaxID=3050130 RepID=UPI0025B72AF0|nr:TonB-dependent receptor [Massilia sp. YIM B02763]MDN4051975.1 TonB-dependent receptor [Massilia sp. YIM B02763]